MSAIKASLEPGADAGAVLIDRTGQHLGANRPALAVDDDSDALAEQHMPGSIQSMHVEHVFRDVQTDRGSLLYGRLLRWQFETATLAHRCRRGASTPSPADTPETNCVTMNEEVRALPEKLAGRGTELSGSGGAHHMGGLRHLKSFALPCY